MTSLRMEDVAPHMGARIEIRKPLIATGKAGVVPMRGRGLKWQIDTKDKIAGRRVAPTWGRGLKGRIAGMIFICVCGSLQAQIRIYRSAPKGQIRPLDRLKF